MAKKSATKKPTASKPTSVGKTVTRRPRRIVGTPTTPQVISEVKPIFEQSAKVGRNADQHTRDTKRQKAIVEVVLSMGGVNLQDLPDDGGELQQVGVTWGARELQDGKLVPYHEIVAAFVAQAPYLAESIKVDDQR